MVWRLCFFVLISIPVFAFEPNLINGKETKKNEFMEVVKIENGAGHCTATVVGSRTLLTAAHCGKNGQKVYFTYKNKIYSAKIAKSKTSKLDIAIAITAKDMTEVTPIEVGGMAKVGTTVALLGYGCSKPQKEEKEQEEEDELDEVEEAETYVLRYGKSQIRVLRREEMVTYTTLGAAGCFGDSGGPVFLESKGKPQLLGVVSKANMKDTTITVRLDLPDTQNVLKTLSKDNGVDVCGITTVCTKKPK